ncbi:MAG: hypothetical protein G01um101466_811 [Parcubacteria group bacterium Gr01-1014_66]|nr:MAG: hypothetical protein G01um101466_811 [Parcubacteria group bacterium Gr01-1014_66]
MLTPLLKKPISSAYVCVFIFIIAGGVGYYIWWQFREEISPRLADVPLAHPRNLNSLRGEYGTASHDPSYHLTIATTTDQGFWFSIETYNGAHSCSLGLPREEFNFALMTGDTDAQYNTGYDKTSTKRETCTLDFDISQPDQIHVTEQNCRSFCGARGPGFENTYIKNVKPQQPGIETLVDSEYERPIKTLIPEKFHHLLTDCSAETFGQERNGNRKFYSYSTAGLHTICGSAIMIAPPDRVWVMTLHPDAEKDGFSSEGHETPALYFTNVQKDTDSPPEEFNDWIESEARGAVYCMNAPERKCGE